MKKLQLKSWHIETAAGEYPMQAAVPSDVTAELYAAGYIPDPLFGTNMKNLSWIAEQEWVYSTEFFADEALLEMARIVLCFDGADTLAQVKINGTVVGNMDNMFLAYRFDAKPYLKLGNNRVEVKFLSSTAYIREKNDGTNYRALFTQDRIYIRKAQCHWGWDWAPKLPGIGLYLPAYLETDDGMRIENVQVRAALSGEVSIHVTVDNGSWRVDTQDYTLEVELDGQKQVIPVKNIQNLLNMKIENPKLWWPNGYGEPHLYPYTVRLLYGGEVVEECTGSFGIRKVEIEEKPVDLERMSFAIKVNGRRIFCKGSNWVPISNMTGAISDGDYEALIHAAKDGNFNMLRVWGGGFYEKEIFYDLCDRSGILLWQDFMFSCSAIPAEIEGMEEKIIPEVEYQIKRLRNRACIGIWCGGNEYMPHLKGHYYKKGNWFVRNTLRGICGEMDADRPYIHNSPYGIGDDEWDFRTGDSHVSCMDAVLEARDIPNFRKHIAANPVQFVSESAMLGPTRLKSLRKFIPEHEIWPTGESWDYHFVENPYAIVPETFLTKEKRFAQALFGDYENAEAFVKKAMLAHAEVLGAEIDFARSNPHCRGFMNWMYNDNWGCGTWSVIDCYMERKPVFYAMKRSFAPVRLALTQSKDGVFATLCNDTAKALLGTMELFWKKYDGTVLKTETVAMDAPADGVCAVKLAEIAEADYIAARFEDTKTVFHLEFGEKTFETALTVHLEYDRIHINAEKFARCVFLDCENGQFSDNYFDMEPGEERIIEVTGTPEKITVKTIADVWED